MNLESFLYLIFYPVILPQIIFLIIITFLEKQFELAVYYYYLLFPLYSIFIAYGYFHFHVIGTSNYNLIFEGGIGGFWIIVFLLISIYIFLANLILSVTSYYLFFRTINPEKNTNGSDYKIKLEDPYADNENS